MALGKQAKVLSKQQTDAVLGYVGNRINGLRDQTIFLLSVRAGLRAKEISCLKWSMITTPDGQIGDLINLTDIASKGNSGRIIPINKQLHGYLVRLLAMERTKHGFDFATSNVITTQRRKSTSPQAIVNMFFHWYHELGLNGCSSHSGRRTFITNAAKKISTVGGSIRDVQVLAGHSSLQTTQRYIDGDTDARRKIVELI